MSFFVTFTPMMVLDSRCKFKASSTCVIVAQVAGVWRLGGWAGPKISQCALWTCIGFKIAPLLVRPLAASSSNPRDIQLVVDLFSSQHTGSYTAQHYLKFKVCRRIW